MEKPLKIRKESTYKYGRRCSRSLGGCITTELCKNIDESLPPAQRLKVLIEISLKNAITIAEQELGEIVDPDKYCDGFTECLNKVDAEISDNDLYTSAVSGDKSIILQKDLADNVSEANKAISKLDEECLQWNEMIAKERALNEAASKENSSLILKGSLDGKMYEPTNFIEFTEDISLLNRNHNLQLQKMETHTQHLQFDSERTKKLFKRLNNEAKKNLSKKIGHTPRSLIKKFYNEI